MPELIVASWDETNIEELATLAVQCRREMGISKLDETIEDFVEKLEGSYESAQYDWVVLARTEDKLLGWVTLWKWDIDILRISNWQPYVMDSNKGIAQCIIEQIIKITVQQELNRIHVAFSRVDDNSLDAYHERAKWYSIQGFYDFHQEYFMRRTLAEEDNYSVDIPTGFRVTSIDNWDPEDLCDTYLNAFRVSSDRFHAQRSEENRKNRFLGMLDSNHTIRDACHVISDGNIIAGFSLVTEHFPPAHLGPFGVNPKYRRKGIGIALALLSIRSLSEHGYNTVSLEVDTENQPALNLYQKVGFKIESESHVFYKDIVI